MKTLKLVLPWTLAGLRHNYTTLREHAARDSYGAINAHKNKSWMDTINIDLESVSTTAVTSTQTLSPVLASNSLDTPGKTMKNLLLSSSTLQSIYLNLTIRDINEGDCWSCLASTYHTCSSSSLVVVYPM